MGEHIIVWDLETIPDIDGFASASQLDGKTEPEIRESMGDKFPVKAGAIIPHRSG